ncbi:MAG TPA: flavodoxin domain-containing protein [Kofleriaceae bacterium]
MRDRPPHVLVAYGSKRGGTHEIAATIAEVLLNEGIDAELAEAEQVRSFEGYDAVILGGALYMNRWHRDARKLITHHASELRALPVWLFSSGPLDDSANERDLPATHQVTELMERIGARGHVMFGGRLEPDAKGFPASAMAKKMAGDWREWHKIKAWAADVAREIRDEEPRPVVIIPAPSRAQRWLLAGLCLFVGITAIGGGATLTARPDGSLLEAAPSMLSHSPFASFLIPGILLLVVVGFGNTIAGVLVARNNRLAAPFTLFAGAALLVWITVEMIMLRSHRWLQIGYFTAAAMILIEAWKLFELPWLHGRAARYATRQLS